MFTGQAEEAMNFYISLFDNSRIDHIARHEAGGPGKEGTVMRAQFSLNGQSFMCIDSPAVHAFTFTPAMSLFIDCGSDAEIEKLFASLSAGGSILMPLGAYPFSKKYGWVTDKYGVSWQINYDK